MRQGTLSANIEQLKKDLQGIDIATVAEKLPVSVLESFKDAVDNVRTTLWAAMSDQTDPYQVGAAVAEMRVKRTMDMCRRIILDIDAQDITLHSPYLLALKNVLTETLERVQRLCGSGM